MNTHSALFTWIRNSCRARQEQSSWQQLQAPPVYKWHHLTLVMFQLRRTLTPHTTHLAAKIQCTYMKDSYLDASTPLTVTGKVDMYSIFTLKSCKVSGNSGEWQFIYEHHLQNHRTVCQVSRSAWVSTPLSANSEECRLTPTLTLELLTSTKMGDQDFSCAIHRPRVGDDTPSSFCFIMLTHIHIHTHVHSG